MSRDLLSSSAESPRRCSTAQPGTADHDHRRPDTNHSFREMAAQLREQRPEIGVLVLSNGAKPADALALLKAGSDGRAYLLKDRIYDGALLVAAVDLVAAGFRA
jgi:DNA-binding NarL/FixJ family response regulator